MQLHKIGEVGGKFTGLGQIDLAQLGGNPRTENMESIGDLLIETSKQHRYHMV